MKEPRIRDNNTKTAENQAPVQTAQTAAPVSTKALTTCALLTALALVFSYIEFLLPLNFGIPGVKLGLANIVVVLALYWLGPKYGLYINIARICLAALLFGSLFSALYALAGGLVSLAVMVLLKRTDKFSLTAVSAAGGVFHNLAQICVAAAITRTAGIFGYFPVLLLAGLATGIFNGIVCILVLRKLR